jgi:hypothetical protein
MQHTPLGVLCVPLRDRHGMVVAVALLDSEDHALATHRWNLNPTTGYVNRTVGGRRNRRGLLLHREVLGLKHGDGLWGDHINRDRLDCRRSNLRVVTRAESAQNVGASQRSTSSYRGASWNAPRGSWRAQVSHRGVGHYLGHFGREEDAAAAVSAWRAEHMPFAVEAA